MCNNLEQQHKPNHIVKSLLNHYIILWQYTRNLLGLIKIEYLFNVMTFC